MVVNADDFNDERYDSSLKKVPSPQEKLEASLIKRAEEQEKFKAQNKIVLSNMAMGSFLQTNRRSFAAPANGTANASANATAPVVDPEDLPLKKLDYKISAGNTTNATDPVQIDGLIHNKDGSRSFPDGTPVGGVNDTWRYAAQKKHR